MQNLQIIPGDTDLEKPLPDERNPTEEKPDRNNDYPTPPDKMPPAPVEEPSTGTPINENSGEPPRIMK
jgi:hypothetical protein